MSHIEFIQLNNRADKVMNVGSDDQVIYLFVCLFSHKILTLFRNIKFNNRKVDYE